ncbi:MAG: stage V sporulation protein D, partial [Armatimonadia bacterium]|nr:stage V sporulation protein D [Armatimonadia bacterium]
PIPHRTTTMAPAKDGSSLKLTLDVKVQQACERELAMGIQEVGAESGCVVVMDVATGDVLAACDYPTFDPNSWQEVDPEVWSPRFSTWIYEPGSTIKPLVVAMALSEGVVSPSSTFYCGGTLEAGDWEVGCGHVDGGHGTVDLTDLLKYSCNVGAAQVGQAAGAEELTRLFKRLGFTDLPTRELPAQCHPLPPYKGPAWCATASFGQGIGITPLHLAAAYGALANGGVMMRPRFVDSAIDAGGHAKEFPPVEVTRVYPRHAARRVVSMLGHVVQDDDGTGHRARVPGCTVAGKTGTAEVVVDGKYEPGQYVVSFVGLLPAEDPRYVIVVVLDRPEGDAYGGTMAAPVFRDIAESLITDLHLPVQRPVAAFEPGEETP